MAISIISIWIKFVILNVLPFALANFLILTNFLVFWLHNQIFGDPDAADIVFTSGSDVLAFGINVTHQVVLTGVVSQPCLSISNSCSSIISYGCTLSLFRTLNLTNFLATKTIDTWNSLIGTLMSVFHHLPYLSLRRFLSMLHNYIITVYSLLH